MSEGQALAAIYATLAASILISVLLGPAPVVLFWLFLLPSILFVGTAAGRLLPLWIAVLLTLGVAAVAAYLYPV